MIYKILITATAKSQMRRAVNWWAEERPDAPSLFIEEFEAALRQLKMVPLAGTRYLPVHSYDLRRILLRRSLYHIYYTVHPADLRVVVRAVWHSARGRKPGLR